MFYNFVIYRHAWRYNLAPDKEPQLTDFQCKELLRHDGLFVRNTFNFDCSEVTDFWYVIKDSFDGMEELSQNVRRRIRKALNIFDIKIIDKQTIKEQGYPIIKATYEDYKVKDRQMSEKIFKDYFEKHDKDNFDFWGVFEKESGKLIGWAAVHVFDNSCEYNLIGMMPGYKNAYPYYGLYYKRNEYYLGEKGFKYVSDGSRSITEHSNIQPFLEQNFKFRKAYCKLKIRYKWWFGAIVRVLLPFRKVIRNRNVKAVLNMHKMQTKS